VRAANENAVINALVRLSRAADTWLAFLTGHGERDFLGQANHDLGEFGKYLGNRGYNIRPLNLAEIQAIPDNTAILALAGPQLPLLPGETRMILDYLTRGGNFLWLLDPEDKPSQQWLSDFFNIDIAAGTVIDISGQLIGINDPTITTITASLYGQHPALENFEFTSLFPKSAALLAGDSDSWSSTPLLTTGELAWLESGSLEGEVEFNSETDTAGPLTIGLGLSRRPDNNTSEQRIAIIGDGDFLSNTYLGNSGNLDLGMRIVDWLSTDDALIDIPVRSASDTQLTVSPAILGGMGILFLIVLPVSLVGIGTFIWWRRRRA
jgi:ABC-type uncharacterized transport system involved in gliding motility auxiliary subunit